MDGVNEGRDACGERLRRRDCYFSECFGLMTSLKFTLSVVVFEFAF